MGKVKISELPVASVVNPTDLIEVVQGGTNKQAVSSLIGGSQTLAQVLANGDTMNNGQFIKSPDGKSTLAIGDGSIEGDWTDGSIINSFGNNSTKGFISAEDGQIQDLVILIITVQKIINMVIQDHITIIHNKTIMKTLINLKA